MNLPRRFILPGLLLMCVLLVGCNASKHVPTGEYLLDKVAIDIVADSATMVSKDEMYNYLRQLPNHKVLWSAKLQLGIYNLSGADTTKWWNRWIRRIGEPPVVYDSTLTQISSSQLRNALINRGYLHAQVEVDTLLDSQKKKASVQYTLKPGEPYIINDIFYEFPNDTLSRLILTRSEDFPVKRGDALNHAILDAQRDLITTTLKERGYYAFTKDFITFTADTTAGSNLVDLAMIVNPPYAKENHGSGIAPLPSHQTYVINKIICRTDYNPILRDEESSVQPQDTVVYRGIEIIYGKNKNLSESLIYNNCYIRRGELFNEKDVTRTYEAFSRLEILKFVNIRYKYAGRVDGENYLDVYIYLTPDRTQSVSFELEGTNSEGDLGVAFGITWAHRNLGKNSETFSAKARGAYESISGNFEGLLHNRYMEYSLETTLQIPEFRFPFVNERFRRSIKASTLFNAAFNYQERPEYTRLIAAASWAYQWSERNSGNRHRFSLLDINYVYLPESTNDFINQIAPDNPLLRYSYEDHFIMSMGYNFYHTNKRTPAPWERTIQKDIYTIRASAETAGNLLFAMSNIFNRRANFRDDPYKIFGIRYSEYFKLEGDFVYIHNFDRRNSLAFHGGMGVAFPYGNSTILPFEKRFYGGGASGVRGWNVRTLGPGSFASTNSVTDFIYQCGDIRLILSAEYRAKLFWVLELGAFIDAGNIWTIKNYATQPGGLFRFSNFYKEIAMAYGLGIRLNFDYFLIRFDLGMKAHNPASGAEPWPILHPRWGRDRSFHFSVGYPF